MKPRIFIFVFLASVLVFLSSAYVQQSAEQLYQSGLYKEEVQGELEEAIAIYKKILKQFPENREIAAKAQLHIGLCYEKLGLKEAQKAYQNVVDNYPEQREAVKVAKEKLSTLVRAQTVIKKGDKEFKIRQVWTGAGVDNMGGPSPDGRYLSFVNWMTGNLAIRELATGKIRNITKEAKYKVPQEFAMNSRISPDGKQIAYSWIHSGTIELRLIGIDGSNRRILYRDQNYEIYPHDWSSDGKYILAVFWREDAANKIVWVSVEDGSVRVLKEIEKMGYTTIDRLCHSPDNRYIAYSRLVNKDSENYDVFLLATDGSGEIPLVEQPANDKLLGWVPGRKEILFLSDLEGSWDVWMIQVADGKPQGFPKPVRRNIGQISPMGFIQDGSFYFSFHRRWATIYTAPFDLETGKVQENLRKSILGSNDSPEWSPNGDYLAYISEQKKPSGGYHRPLHIRHVKTGKERELAGHLDVRIPRWSPDGRSILVTGYDTNRQNEKEYNGGLYQIDVQDSHVTELLQFPPVQNWMQDVWWNMSLAEWSRDGKAVFYINGGKLVMLELESGREKQLYQDPNLAKILDVSPDDKRLVFGLSDFGGVEEKRTWRILMMPAPGGEVQELCKFQGGERIRGLSWAPNGKYVLFTKNDEKGSNLWRITPEGRKPQKLWHSKNRNAGLSIHPNGQQIAFASSFIEVEIRVMENFLPLVKK